MGGWGGERERKHKQKFPTNNKYTNQNPQPKKKSNENEIKDINVNSFMIKSILWNSLEKTFLNLKLYVYNAKRHK